MLFLPRLGVEDMNDRDTQAAKRKKYRGAAATCYEWAEAIVAALAVLVLAFSFFMRIVTVEGTSMLPNLVQGDKVFLTSGPYKPATGDIIVVEHATKKDEPIIKRVIATGGQSVRIDSKEGSVYVDGKKLDERAYLAADVKTVLPDGGDTTMEVPAGKLFVLGDNRGVSLDSRYPEVGFIEMDHVMGKAHAVVFPLHRFGKVKE